MMADDIVIFHVLAPRVAAPLAGWRTPGQPAVAGFECTRCMEGCGNRKSSAGSTRDDLSAHVFK